MEYHGEVILQVYLNNLPHFSLFNYMIFFFRLQDSTAKLIKYRKTEFKKKLHNQNHVMTMTYYMGLYKINNHHELIACTNSLCFSTFFFFVFIIRRNSLWKTNINPEREIDHRMLSNSSNPVEYKHRRRQRHIIPMGTFMCFPHPTPVKRINKLVANPQNPHYIQPIISGMYSNSVMQEKGMSFTASWSHGT